MATQITTETDATLSTLGASSERLARASIAAGFAMVEELPDDPAREQQTGAVRRTWHTLEHYLAHFLTGAPARPSGLSAWQQ